MRRELLRIWLSAYAGLYAVVVRFLLQSLKTSLDTWNLNNLHFVEEMMCKSKCLKRKGGMWHLWLNHARNVRLKDEKGTGSCIMLAPGNITSSADVFAVRSMQPI